MLSIFLSPNQKGVISRCHYALSATLINCNLGQLPLKFLASRQSSVDSVVYCNFLYVRLRGTWRYILIPQIMSRYRWIFGTITVYSCFEKGCLTNGDMLTRQCRKLLWVMVVFTVVWVNLKVFQRGGRKQHKHVLVFLVPCCWIILNLYQAKPNSFYPMPLGIVTYAFTLSWDNLCRNSCIQKHASVDVRHICSTDGALIHCSKYRANLSGSWTPNFRGNVTQRIQAKHQNHQIVSLITIKHFSPWIHVDFCVQFEIFFPQQIKSMFKLLGGAAGFRRHVIVVLYIGTECSAS